MRARFATSLSCALCLSFGLTAAAAAPLSAFAAPASDDEAITKAKQYYQSGKAKFDTADYLGAIDLWQQAYGSLSNDDAAAEIRAALAYNIAAAREEAYKLSGDVLELKRARVLLTRYIADTEAVVAAGEERDQMLAPARERLRRIIKLIDEEEAKSKPAGGTGTANDPPDNGDSTDPEAPAGASGNTTDPNPIVDGGEPGAKSGKPLIYAGAGVAALGLAGVGVGAAFMAIGKSKNDEVTELVGPDDEDARIDAINGGERANTLAVVGMVGGGVLLATGGVLIGLGVKRERSSQVAAVPWMNRQGAGLSFSGRF